MSSPFDDHSEADGSGLERILFCFAVEQEAKFFSQRMEILITGIGRENAERRVHAALTREPYQLVVSCGMEILITGIGRENAERSLHTALKREPYQLVVSCGFAGGLNPYLSTGTVVFATDEDAGLTPLLLTAGACPVKFYSSDRVAITVAEKRKLWEQTGADAVEMESQIIRAICRAHSIPSATIRVISDAADENLPLDFNALMTADQRLNYPKLILTLLTSPMKIPALLRLQRQTQLAARNLADVLSKVIPSC